MLAAQTASEVIAKMSASAVRPTSQVAAEGERLSKELCEMHNLLSALQDRMIPVLMPMAVPGTVEPNGDSPRPVRSPLAGELSLCADNAATAADRIRSLIEQLTI